MIDADSCLNQAWQNFYKQEDEHEKNIDGYDIMRDQFYEQSGFECCQQTIVNAPTVEAIPKDQYEARLKADMVAMLEDLKREMTPIKECEYQIYGKEHWNFVGKCQDVIQEKINALRGENGNE